MPSRAAGGHSPGDQGQAVVLLQEWVATSDRAAENP
jgi:hypothetical protein